MLRAKDGIIQFGPIAAIEYNMPEVPTLQASLQLMFRCRGILQLKLYRFVADAFINLRFCAHPAYEVYARISLCGVV
jgi:hypothetical protein